MPSHPTICLPIIPHAFPLCFCCCYRHRNILPIVCPPTHARSDTRPSSWGPGSTPVSWTSSTAITPAAATKTTMTVTTPPPKSLAAAPMIAAGWRPESWPAAAVRKKPRRLSGAVLAPAGVGPRAASPNVSGAGLAAPVTLPQGRGGGGGKGGCAPALLDRSPPESWSTTSPNGCRFELFRVRARCALRVPVPVADGGSCTVLLFFPSCLGYAGFRSRSGIVLTCVPLMLMPVPLLFMTLLLFYLPLVYVLGFATCPLEEKVRCSVTLRSCWLRKRSCLCFSANSKKHPVLHAGLPIVCPLETD